MFFSDELLTGKKGSLGIVWLMATLGPRSKRVSRKAITNLEISQTCELIATPAEPMALRLSGHLLVGVARVYHQSCLILYDEVEAFAAVIRRSLANEDFSRGKRVVGGIDLPGDGTSRPEQITFSEVTLPEFMVDFDLHTAGIDWEHPMPSQPGLRRASSWLSSLQGFFPQTQDSYSDASGDNHVAFDEDDLNEEPVRRYQTPQTNGLGRFTRTPSVDQYRYMVRASDNVAGTDDEPFEPMDLGYLHDDLDDPLSGTISFHDPAGDIGNVDPNVQDFGDLVSFEREDLIPTGSEPVELHALLADVPHGQAEANGKAGGNGGANADPPAVTKSQAGAEEDAEEPVQAPPKKKAKRNAIAAPDDKMELDAHSGTQDYEEHMSKTRNEKLKKKLALQAEATADQYISGWGMLMEFTDKGMLDFMATFTKLGKFQWQLDREENTRKRRRDSEDVPNPEELLDALTALPSLPDADLNLIHSNQDLGVIPDNSGGNIMQDGDQGQYDYHFLDLDLNPAPAREPLPVARRRSSQGSQVLPWMGIMEDDNNVWANNDFAAGMPSSDPSPRRMSMMTPLESLIRSRTASANRSRFARSASIMSVDIPGLVLIPDNDPRLDNVEDEQDDDLPPGPFPTGPFSAKLLALLEMQCREFLVFIEKCMADAGTDETLLEDIIDSALGQAGEDNQSLPSEIKRRTAVAAFHNCLTLASKGNISVAQEDFHGPITICLIATPTTP